MHFPISSQLITSEVLQGLLAPHQVHACVLQMDTFNIDFISKLAPEEIAFAQKLGPKRQNEFLLGRFCAKQALKKLDPTLSAPLLNDPNGVPIWPVHIKGCISHTKDLCAVVVSKNNCNSIGLDIEQVDRCGEKIWSAIATQNELKQIYSFPENMHNYYASIIFSAKESVYKSQYVLTQEFIGFKEAECLIDLHQSSFEIKFITEKKISLDINRKYCGRFFINHTHVVAACVL